MKSNKEPKNVYITFEPSDQHWTIRSAWRSRTAATGWAKMGEKVVKYVLASSRKTKPKSSKRKEQKTK